MKTYYSRKQLEHNAAGEFNRGAFVQAFERPDRALSVLAAVEAAHFGAIEAPTEFSLDPILRIHDAAFVKFLQTAYAEWKAMDRPGDALPMMWNARVFREDKIPESLDGRLGYYSFDISSAIAAGTWDAVKAAADVALAGAVDISSGREKVAFSLCRPPGHHAASDCYGGYCYLNNAAIAAQYCRDHGANRVAILDVDFHHGNGTQQIFYSRSDVLFASLHGDPKTEYPYFLGYADEKGKGEGEGFNHNYPLPRGTDWDAWNAALTAASKVVDTYKPDALIVSLGVDTYKNDPISSFKLDTQHYALMGQAIAKLGKPTLFVMEGGYAIGELGTNAVNVLKGFENA